MIGPLLALIAAAWAAPEAPVEEEAPAVLTEQDVGQLLVSVAKVAATGDRDATAALLVDIVSDPLKAPAHGQAWMMLADNLQAFELPYASLIAFGHAIDGAPQAAGPKLGEMLELADDLGESGPISEALGKNVGLPIPDKIRNRMATIAGRHHLAAGNYGPALGILMMGDSEQPGFADVELLRGVVLSQQGRYGDALAPMLTAQALGEKDDRESRFRNRATVNVARAFYATGNYGQAINYYAKVERGSDVWLDAQFERAWAHFRGKDTNGTLAMVFNHSSPFFDDYYYPEAHLLRAYSLFLMCKFPEASKEMDAFQARWEPVKALIDGIAMSPAEAFADVQAFRSDGQHELPAYLIRSFRYDDRFEDATRSIESADADLARAEGLSNEVGRFADKLIRSQRAARIAAEGQRVLDRVQSAQTELDDMLAGIQITRIDLLSLEAEMYERAAATGVLDYGDKVGKLRQMRKDRRGFRVWKWQGEYWADEVGWYVFGARPDCPSSMSSTPTTGG